MDLQRRAEEARQQACQRGVTRFDRRRLILLEHIRRDDAAADDPQTAAGVPDVDDRQRRQHAHHESANERRLGVAGFSRNTPVPDG